MSSKYTMRPFNRPEAFAVTVFVLLIPKASPRLEIYVREQYRRAERFPETYCIRIDKVHQVGKQFYLAQGTELHTIPRLPVLHDLWQKCALAKFSVRYSGR